ncbi:hypothetical protein D3C75_1216080 [compost metagenome]
MLAAWEGDVRHLGEQVETTTVLATDGLAQQLARQVSGVEPMAGISLGKVHIRLVR